MATRCDECKGPLAVRVKKGFRYFSDEYKQWLVRGESDGRLYCESPKCPERDEPARPA
jgi:hypothetical protein